LGSNRAVPFLLVQRSLTPPEIEPVLRAFQSTGIFPALDAVSFIKDAFGVLAKGLEDYPAKQLQMALATQGVEVDVVNESEWPQLPPAKRIVRASCWAEGFGPWDPLGRELHVPWERVVAVSAGLVKEVEFGKRVSANVSLGGSPAPINATDTDWHHTGDQYGGSFEYGPPLPVNRLVLTGEERNWRWCAEVILAGGLRFVWQAHKFQFASLGDRLSRDPAVNFGIFLRDLLSAVPNALLNRGAFAVRENQPETGPRYPTRNAFGEETQWMLWRLRRAGRYAPTADA
jgi:hypothetical protein